MLAARGGGGPEGDGRLDICAVDFHSNIACFDRDGEDLWDRQLSAPAPPPLSRKFATASNDFPDFPDDFQATSNQATPSQTIFRPLPSALPHLVRYEVFS